MPDFVALACPFCVEPDFDAMGLKLHLSLGWCDAYNDTPLPASMQGSVGALPAESTTPTTNGVTE
jgi:hypothetical protein